MSEDKAEYKIEGNPSTIFRVKKCRDNPYAMVDMRPILNDKLSWKAKGILVYLLSRPDGWEVNLVDLANRSTDGLSSVKSGCKELKEAGHLKHVSGARDEEGHFGTVIWEVHEVPLPQVVVPQVENQPTAPQVDLPQVENPQAGNQPQVLLTDSSIDSINKNTLSPEEIERITQREKQREIDELTNAQNKLTWRGREYIDPCLADLLDVFVRDTGMKPSKDKLSDWMCVAQEWIDLELIPEDIHVAYEVARENGFLVNRPGSLTNTANACAGKRRQMKEAKRPKEEGVVALVIDPNTGRIVTTVPSRVEA